MDSGNQHIILVHGACHGAWSWHKVADLLRSAGHRVTVPDLAASGADERRFEDISTFADYNRPVLDLLASLPPGEKAVLVGHSLGGLNIAFAMEAFPEKVAAGVFVTAFMPDCTHTPDHVFSPLKQLDSPESFWLDTEFGSTGDPEKGPLSMLFGPEFLAKLYALSPREDLAMATSLVRTSSLFMDDLAASPPLSEKGYGSVEKVYVVCAKDQAISEEFQRWMIENSNGGGGRAVKEVKVIEEADHMPMLSTPTQLCDCLLDSLVHD